MPLIIKLPGRREARRVSGLVGLVDIMPTVCRALGIEVSGDVHGIDLMGRLTGQPSPGSQRSLYCQSVTATQYGAGALTGIVTDRWKYIHAARAELYDLVADPHESNNLLTVRGDVAKRLYDQLAQKVERSTTSHNASDGKMT